MAQRERGGWAGLALVLASVVGGCTGTIGDARTENEASSFDPSGAGDPFGAVDPSEAGDPPGSTSPPTGGGPLERCEGPEVGPATLRRLTRTEYERTIQDLLGDDSARQLSFLDDEEVGPFRSNSSLPVTDLIVEKYQNAAWALAARTVAEENEGWARWLSCAPEGQGDAACASSFIDHFGAKAYRRPLSADERDALVALAAQGESFRDGIERVIAAMLQSPSFLYRVELAGEPASEDTVRLTSYEVATRLSYFLWGTTPDDTLLEAAAEDALRTAEQIAAHTERMLESPRARVRVAEFYREWLDLDDLDSVSKVPELGDFDALRESMKAETLRFTEHVTFEGDARLSTLLTAPFTFADARLAEHYGAGHPGGAEISRVELDPAQRTGFLTHASFLALHASPSDTSPLRRGLFIRERLFCQPLPPPPPGAIDQLPDREPGMTTRELFELHRSEPVCASCHNLMEPIGFAFEHYDAMGRYRETEGGEPVDARGELLEIGGDEVLMRFDGAIDLAQQLATSDEVENCMVAQWYRFAHGHSEGCGIEDVRAAFESGEGNIRDLIVALTTSEAFRTVRVEEAP